MFLSQEKVQYYDIATEKRAEFDCAIAEYVKRKVNLFCTPDLIRYVNRVDYRVSTCRTRYIKYSFLQESGEDQEIDEESEFGE